MGIHVFNGEPRSYLDCPSHGLIVSLVYMFGIDGCCNVCATRICYDMIQYIMGFAILVSSQFYMETMVKSVSSCSK